MNPTDLAPPAWTADAACAQPGRDPENWFAEGPDPVSRRRQEIALDVCEECPVRALCLEWALATEPTGISSKFGIWGGMTGPQRYRLQRARRRAA